MLGILATWETEIGRIVARGQSMQKLVRLHLSEELGVVACACYPSYVGGWYSEDSGSRLAWAKKNWETLSQ
jgi:hypothetical protein